MLRKLMAVAAVAAATALAACESGPTPYQPGSAVDRSYSEQKIESDRYRISFKGNSMTDRETVENYMLFRAAELTLQSGYEVFTIVDRETDKDRSVRRSGPYFGSRFSYSYFSPRWGWVHGWDPFWHSYPSRFDEVTRYEAFAEIVMSRGPKGSDPNAFDARQVSQNLSPTIQRPAS
jgi:hypothetical protein